MGAGVLYARLARQLGQNIQGGQPVFWRQPAALAQGVPQGRVVLVLLLPLEPQAAPRPAAATIPAPGGLLG